MFPIRVFFLNDDDNPLQHRLLQRPCKDMFLSYGSLVREHMLRSLMSGCAFHGSGPVYSVRQLVQAFLRVYFRNNPDSSCVCMRGKKYLCGE